MPGPDYHGWTHGPNGSDPAPGASGFVLHYKVLLDVEFLATGDGKLTVGIPEEMDGMSLVSAESYVTTVSSSGTVRVQVRNVTQAHDMLSTRIDIDASEYTSYTCGTRSVVNGANAAVATGDRIAFDLDLAGTNAQGLGVWLGFE